MIVVAGEALVDLIPNADGNLSATVGGGPLNTARWLGRLGSKVSFLGAVAGDQLGVRIRESLADCGVSLELLIETPAPTTLALAELDAAGGARYSFYVEGTSAADVGGDQAAGALTPELEALHVGGLGLVLEPVGSVVEELAVRARRRGALVMLDPNIRPSLIGDRERYMTRLQRIIGHCDVLKLSVEDLAWIAPKLELARAAESLRAAGPAVVLVTAGEHGVDVFSAAIITHLAARAVTVVDTIGAGDAFNAGFLTDWQRRGYGREQLADTVAVSQAAIFATEVAALACAERGATPPARIAPFTL